MPSSTKHFFHKNRSQASLNFHDPLSRRPPQASPSDSPLPSPAFAPDSGPTATSAPFDSVTSTSPAPPLDNYDEHSVHALTTVDESRFVPAAIPTRSQSQRSPTIDYGASSTTTPPNQHLVSVPSSPSVGVASPAPIELRPDVDYSSAPSAAVPKEDRRKRFFRLGLSAREPPSNSGGVNPPGTGIGRSLSRRRAAAPQIVTDTGSRPVQQRWSAFVGAPASEAEKDGAGLDSWHRQSLAHLPSGPPLPEKDPITAARLATPPGFPVRGTSLAVAAVNSVPRVVPSAPEPPPHSPWAQSVPSVPELHPHPDAPDFRPPSHLPSPASATSTSSPHLLSRLPAETAFPVVHPDRPSRPQSQHSFAPPSPLLPHHARDDQPYRGSLHPAHTPGSMGPPAQPPLPRPGSNELGQLGSPSGALHRDNSYQSYAPGQPGPHPTPGASAQFGSQLGIHPPGTNSYRGAPQSSPMTHQSSGDAGRTSPSSRSYDDMTNMDVAQVVAKYYELQDKYRKVKRYYFDKDAQVQQLQNTLAHQRLSQSRTSLDDNEYAARFSRLDGAINQLSFHIRREWRAVPPWLGPSVNRDAPSSPTKEMTAVGRACISRWLVDELLDRYFHPSLDPVLSAHLKIVEKNLRRFAAPTPSEEEKDALMARIANWRLTTVDGLQEMLASPQAVEYRTALTDMLVEKMTASLGMSLKEPAPAGLEGGVRMIVELAVGLAANIPLESRDVFVDYVVPGTLVNETYMKIESGLPPLINPGDALSDGASGGGAGGGGGGEKGTDEGNNGLDGKDDRAGEDNVSVVSVGSVATSGGVGSISGVGVGGSGSGIGSSSGSGNGSTSKEQKKKSMFGGLMSGTKKTVGSGAGGGGGGGMAGSSSSSSTTAGGNAAALSQQQAQGQGQGQGQIPKEERVRFSTFMAVEVRGRNVLVRAPVYV